MKKILFIAAGQFQLAGIKEAQDNGAYVIAVDGNPEAAGKDVADEFHHIDILDKKKIVELAKQKKIDAAISIASEISIETVAYVNESLGLPGFYCDTADFSHNKVRYYSVFRKIGLNIPKTYYNRNEALRKLKCDTCIIKPSKGSGSRGVMQISVRDLPNFDEVAYLTENVHSDELIIYQERIEGREMTIDGFLYNSEFFMTAISEEFNYSDYSDTVSKELFFPPSGFDEIMRQEIISICTSIGTCLHLTFSPLHLELKYRDGTFYIIDFSLRGGGFDLFTVITEKTSGIDALKIFIRASLGLHFELRQPLSFHPVVLRFCYAEKAGTIHDISSNYPEGSFENYRLFFLKKKGDVVEKPKDGKSRLAYFICWGNNSDSILKLADKIESNIRFDIR